MSSLGVDVECSQTATEDGSDGEASQRRGGRGGTGSGRPRGDAWARGSGRRGRYAGQRPRRWTRQSTVEGGRRGLFFLTAPLAITSYHTNKTRLAEAPFGLVGDDNGPGLEPPPRNRIGIATAFVPSRRRSPAVSGGLRRPPES
ncbi:hypothetical protein THAOC_01080 [Thalassiosira oceanica]|uniref:Uncharacterized protein n=1 Tax=Thalassiosira oceanica TaxID=159749 RepID=K0THX6_THAOC|nr:hypothetical protein THAOC_01080 [Thalassiosira oceanica]|eukprot:EJK77110.1 hypothetical protein THAOC_01080 [Thalassiosira oceanica]